MNIYNNTKFLITFQDLYYTFNGHIQSAHTTNLDCFFLDVDLDVERRGDEVEPESFLQCVGERDLDFCTVVQGGLGRVLTGEEEFASSSEPSKHSDLSGLVPGSLEADLDLETSCSLDELATSFCSSSLLGTSVWACNVSEELPTWGLVAATVATGFHTPARCQAKW